MPAHESLYGPRELLPLMMSRQYPGCRSEEAEALTVVTGDRRCRPVIWAAAGREQAAAAKAAAAKTSIRLLFSRAFNISVSP